MRFSNIFVTISSLLAASNRNWVLFSQFLSKTFFVCLLILFHKYLVDCPEVTRNIWRFFWQIYAIRGQKSILFLLLSPVGVKDKLNAEKRFELV